MKDLKEIKQIALIDLISIKKSINNKPQYILNESKEIREEEIDQIVESTYDSIFKSIFTVENILNGKSDKDRLINMLNSILFPGNEESKIKEISLLPNEYHKISDNLVKYIKFDITWKAKLQTKQGTQTIDIEMQLGKDSHIKTRLFNYCSSLSEQTNCPTIILSFLNTKDTINISFSSIHLEEQGPKGNKIQYLNFIEIIIINLKEEIEK